MEPESHYEKVIQSQASSLRLEPPSNPQIYTSSLSTCIMALLFQLQVVLQSICTLLVLLSYPFIKTLPLTREKKFLRPLLYLVLLPLGALLLSLAVLASTMAFSVLFIMNILSLYLLSPVKKTHKFLHTVFSVEVTSWQ